MIACPSIDYRDEVGKFLVVSSAMAWRYLYLVRPVSSNEAVPAVDGHARKCV